MSDPCGDLGPWGPGPPFFAREWLVNRCLEGAVRPGCISSGFDNLGHPETFSTCQRKCLGRSKGRLFSPWTLLPSKCGTPLELVGKAFKLTALLPPLGEARSCRQRSSGHIGGGGLLLHRASTELFSKAKQLDGYFAASEDSMAITRCVAMLWWVVGALSKRVKHICTACHFCHR